MNQNYQRMLEELIRYNRDAKIVPSLVLHSCCAPCSSYCLEYLSSCFHITLFYYNPNIYPKEEYEKRVREQERFIGELPVKNPVSFFAGEYDTDRFYQTVKGLENQREGAERCRLCYKLRLSETAKFAAGRKADYFTTTLSISPHKNARALNEIGEAIGNEYGVSWLFSDFKKKDGFKRSTELSNQYGMYRQDYCGCIFSMRN